AFRQPRSPLYLLKHSSCDSTLPFPWDAFVLEIDTSLAQHWILEGASYQNAWDRACELLSLPSDTTNDKGPEIQHGYHSYKMTSFRQTSQKDVVLSIQHLSRIVGGISLVTDITVGVHTNELLAVVGPSGAGKS